jgi:hypothetical protein
VSVRRFAGYLHRMLLFPTKGNHTFGKQPPNALLLISPINMGEFFNDLYGNVFPIPTPKCLPCGRLEAGTAWQHPSPIQGIAALLLV